MRFVSLLVLGCLAPELAGAALSTTDGWMIGMEVGGAFVSFEDDPRDRAGLFGARAGYGLNRVVTPYLAVYEADVDTPERGHFDQVTFGGYDLGVRLHLADDRRRWVPYGDVAATFWMVPDVLEDGEPSRTTPDFDGKGFSLGGGLAFYLSNKWAVDVNCKWSRGGFDQVPVGGAIGGLALDASSVRVSVGVSWWP